MSRTRPGSARNAFRMLSPAEVSRWSRDLRAEELAGAGFYWDAQVDDGRLVLETLRSAGEEEPLSDQEIAGYKSDARQKLLRSSNSSHVELHQ